MADKSRRLMDVVVAGVDFPAKVKIEEVLGQDVLVTDFSFAESLDQVEVDAETGEVKRREYANINVDTGDALKTFSTGAMPVLKVLKALERKIEDGEVELPLLAAFHKEGRTYVIR